MAEPLPVVRLKNAWHSTHPWIFQRLVEKPAQRPKPGSIVDVVGVDGSLRRTITLGTVDSRTPAARWTAKELGGTGAVLLRLRIEGVTVAQERMILLP